MARHTLNISLTVWNRDQKQWSVEWRVRLVFPQAALEYSEERVSEELLLGDLLKRYIHQSESDPVIRHRLRCYVGEDVAVFLKLEKSGRTSARYYQLQVQSSLMECLRNRSIVEYPELHVVLPLSVPEYMGLKGAGPPCVVQEERAVRDSSAPSLEKVHGSSLGRLAESYTSDCEE
jgi:hypothetical protein